MPAIYHDINHEDVVNLVAEINTNLNPRYNEEAIDFRVEAYMQGSDWGDDEVRLRVYRKDILVVESLQVAKADWHTYAMFIRAMVEERSRGIKLGMIRAVTQAGNDNLVSLGIKPILTHNADETM